MEKIYFKDFYGASASITKHNNGKATLVIASGNKTIRKKYDSFKGARIAMGKYSDCWSRN